MFPDVPVHGLQLEELFQALQADGGNGLSSTEAAERLAKYGPNSISAGKKANVWHILLQQLRSPVVYLLLGAALLSGIFSEWGDVTIILIVVAVNTLTGFLLEWQAIRSMEALKQLSNPAARVYRDGQLTTVPAETLVPGDLLYLEAGDMTPVDGRIISSTQLQADESALTGESAAVEKSPGILSEDTPLPERRNMLFKGTAIRKGNARLLCTATGMHTELGAIASMVQSADKSATPLEKKLEMFSRQLMGITIVIVALIFITGIYNNIPIAEMLRTSVALAVAAIPEGLAIVATLALAKGMLRMARRHVIVKKLSAVETLGATTVICTDKTGTLTENRMELTWLNIPPGMAWRKDIPGDGVTHRPIPPGITQSSGYERLLQAAMLCNTATIQGQEATGDPLEVSLLRFAAAHPAAHHQPLTGFRKIAEKPFTSEDRIMGMLHRYPGGLLVTAKGAAEDMLERCTHILEGEAIRSFTAAEKEKWMQATQLIAAEGLKALAFACRETDQQEENFMHSLVFTGLAGFMDPPRENVQEAIQQCMQAKIRVIMLTGDHPAAAMHVASLLGITAKDNGKVITGREMKAYHELEAADKERWMQASVFARVSPRQKLDLVTLLQERQQVVAMTGDGVNDAPALKKADIGIAMGIRGTQVSQEAADMVLKDDAFSSIVFAVKQGRIIFRNIRRFIVYLLSCNLSELLVIGSIAALNLPFRMFPLQILFINLVTDVLPALALGITHGSDHVMEIAPERPGMPAISRTRWYAIWTYAAVIAAAAICPALIVARRETGSDHTNNVLFFTLIFSQLLHVLNMSSAREPFLKNDIIRSRYIWAAIAVSAAGTALTVLVPFLSSAFQITGMGYYEWLLTAGFGLGSMVVIRLLKKMKLIV